MNSLTNWTLEAGCLTSPEGRRFALHPIAPAEAERMSPGIYTKDATERAVVFLRMLLGARHWSDGYERKMDDCFEMNDGDDVVRCLVDIAEANHAVRALITRHSNIGEKCYLKWVEFARKEAV